MPFSPVFGISQQQISRDIRWLDSLSTTQIEAFIHAATRSGRNGNLKALADRVIAGRTTMDEYSLR